MGVFGGGGVKTRAGLFIFGGVMQYIELSSRGGGGYQLEQCIDLPYESGAGGGDLFSSQAVVEQNLRELKRALGKRWARNVCAGIQSKDVLLRTVDLPKMALDDIKGAFRFEFDRFFPIPVDDAVYDVAFIDRPAQDDATAGAIAYCLASAVRRASVENLMSAAMRVGLKLSAIEPSPVAMLRCLCGPTIPMGYNVYALAGVASSMMIASYKDNGVVYRNTSHSFATYDEDGSTIAAFTRDLQSTLNFAATQMRGFSPDKIHIGGYGAARGEELRTSVAQVSTAPVEIVDPWKRWNIQGQPGETFGWEVVLGLALRPSGGEAR